MEEQAYRRRPKNRAQRVRLIVAEAFDVSPDVEVPVGDDEGERAESNAKSKEPATWGLLAIRYPAAPALELLRRYHRDPSRDNPPRPTAVDADHDLARGRSLMVVCLDQKVA